MIVPLHKRDQGIGSSVLQEFERWVIELHYTACILETGKKQPEAIGLYIKNNYIVIPNDG
jgi:putative acetyltransferase